MSLRAPEPFYDLKSHVHRVDTTGLIYLALRPGISLPCIQVTESSPLNAPERQTTSSFGPLDWQSLRAPSAEEHSLPLHDDARNVALVDLLFTISQGLRTKV